MSAAKETVYLVCSEVDENHNKYWKGILYENGDVYCEWGRVGDSKPGNKIFPGAGKSFLDKKVRDKKKGKLNKETGKQVCYTEAKIVEGTDGGVATASVNNGSAAVVAKRDIKTGKLELDALVDRLIKSNIHNITTNTTITYSSTTGLFSTPLGIVTPDAIADARTILADIKRFYRNEDKVNALLARYLRLIPHDVGRRKLRVTEIFPNDDAAIQKESNVLDSLEASYDALQTQAKVDISAAVPTKVFDVSMDVIKPGSAEWDRLVKKFVGTNKAMHHYTNKRIINIYEVDIASMTSGFDSKVGNNTEVFHGTSEANLLSILKSGLRTAPPSTAYIAGKMFGNGIYGTETSSKALGYTFGRWGGSTSQSGWMFICDFAMGKPYYPNTYGLRGSTVPKGYDSCWALPKNTGLHNDELIVYRNQQVRITRLLEIR